MFHIEGHCSLMVYFFLLLKVETFIEDTRNMVHRTMMPQPLQNRHLGTSQSSPNCHQLPYCIVLNLINGLKSIMWTLIQILALTFTTMSKLSDLFFKIFYLFTFRERGRGEEREGEKHQCGVTSPMPPTGDLAYNPGMCPDCESNW